ncbi:MAG: hypothetical protein O7D91_16975 [Planctomycetota bacterium]|nr:hypothetical protein [Planctomycetota bacterium]
MRNYTRITWFLIGMSMASHGCQATRSNKSQVKRIAPTGIEEFDSLNDLFVAAYHNARESEKTSKSVIIEVFGSRMRLFRDGELVEQAVVTPTEWRILRVVAHVPLGIYLRLSPHLDEPLPDSTVALVEGYLKRIRHVAKRLETAGLTHTQLRRQRNILKCSERILEAVRQEHKVSTRSLDEFAVLVGPLVLANAKDAAKSQIDAMHASLTKWSNSLSVADWNTLRFVVRGKRQPRKGNVAILYFSTVIAETLGEHGPPESERVIYAEDLFGKETSRDLLAAMTADARASSVFFGDATRLSTDILAEGAEEYVRLLVARDPVRPR